MTNALIQITMRDLELYPSERLTDNDDGGGFPISDELTGADNELFNPVAPIDNANGSWSSRLIYCAVTCPDDAPLYGSYFAITKPPQNPAVSYFAMEAKRFAETRKEMTDDIEKCRVKDGKRYSPVSENLKGENSFELKNFIVQANIDIEIGDVLYLEAEYIAVIPTSATNPVQTQKKIQYGEFVKVESVDIYDYEITMNDSSGISIKDDRYGCIVTTTKTFENTYTLDDALTRDYITIVTNSFKHEIFKTKVVEDYRLYGVKKLETTVAKDTQTIKIDGLTDKFAPFYNGKIIDTDGINVMTLNQSADAKIFAINDTILISNQQSDDLVAPHNGGDTVQLSRTELNRICLKDANGTPINAELWSYDLELGTITWATVLDTSSYVMPITAYHSHEELNVIDGATDDGTLSLRFVTLHDYSDQNTYVSSVINKGIQQVRVSVPFTQRNWNGKWSDTPKGDQLLNKLNLTQFPMILTDDGAITERWLIKFISNSQFELYGERMGYIGTYDTLTDLVVRNLHDNSIILQIPKEAFGNQATWASQDIIRFNTWGTLFGVQIIRVVHPNRNVQTDSDGFKMCLYGATTEI